MPSPLKAASFPCFVLGHNTRNWQLLLSAAPPAPQRRSLSFLKEILSLQAQRQVVKNHYRAVTPRGQHRYIAMAMKKSDYLSEVWKDGIFSKSIQRCNLISSHSPSQTTKSFSARVATAPSAAPRFEQWSTSAPMPASSAETSRRPNPWPGHS
jgi:hypothetical protein